MAMPHAASGEPVDLYPGAGRHPEGSRTLVRADHLEVFVLTLPAGKFLQEHRAAGAITLQCLDGAVEFTAHGRTHTLGAGSLVYLADAEPHAVQALEASALLITLLLRRA